MQYINTDIITQGTTTLTVTVIPATSSHPSASVTSLGNVTIPATGGPSGSLKPPIPVSPSSTIPLNSTSPAMPSSPPLPGCPAANGTYYVTQGQTFLILCDVNYPGPDDQGLIVPSLHQCIDDCAIVNVGFSSDNCYAASYNPNLGPDTPDCFFRTDTDSTHPIPDDSFISGLLISPINGTNQTIPSGTGIFPSGTGLVPSGSAIYPTGSNLMR